MEVGIAVGELTWSTASNDFDHIRLHIDGSISVDFSSYEYGELCNMSVDLSEEDMDLPIEETVARYKKKREDEVKKKEEEKLERERKDRIQAEERKEKTDRANYERLKAKFEGS